MAEDKGGEQPQAMSVADCSKESKSSWDLMPPDLLGRCFDPLPHRERCRNIPLVCRAFRDSHLSRPPQPKSWIASEPLSHSRVQWFLRICQQVENLKLHIPAKPQWPRAPAQDSRVLLYMLERAELHMLHKLQLSGVWAPHAPVAQLFGTPPLGRVRELSLEGWLITKDSVVQDFQSLSYLQSLTSFDVKWEGFHLVTGNMADAMWEALATLKDLKSLSLSPSKKILYQARDQRLEYGSKPFFFKRLTSVSQIRHLTVNDADVCLDEDGYVHPSFYYMTQLTSVDMIGKCASGCFQLLAGLTQLEKVRLGACDEEINI